MANNRTVFQSLSDLFIGGGPGTGESPVKKTVSYNIDTPQVLYQTNNKADYERKKSELRQQQLLNYQWKKTGADAKMQSMSNLTNIQLMYRDADLMANEPEIDAALDIVMEESCCLNNKGRLLNIYSKSKRIKGILDDLFINRLDINIMLPMIAREMVKYGNSFAQLHIDGKNGILGWRKQEVYSIQRLEDGYLNPYAPTADSPNDLEPHETKFIWVGHNENLPFHSWQMAHFRNLSDALFLPYGTSWLHKARRAWRMVSMMEDAMFLYRLDKSIERRIFKIYVGAINENDVGAYVDQVADNFKRTPVIDPLTGQIDLRKNFLDVSADYFIPIRGNQDMSSIETLAGANNTTSMDDIEYMHNKVLAALRIPKTFLNFQEPQGKGQNLSLLDIRFCRMIQRIQQSLLMELNKIAMIHLYLMGYADDLTNFTLTMNNPSAQIDALELEDLTKRVQTAAAALADPGIGMPLLSLHKVLRDVMKMTDDEISQNLNEIRLEKAMSAELQATAQIIKKTGMFDQVDRIYGDPDALNSTGENIQPDEGNAAQPSGGGGQQGFDGGSMSSDSLGGTNGEAGVTSMANAADASQGTAGATTMMEQILRGKNSKQRLQSFMEQYMRNLKLGQINEGEISNTFAKIENKNLMINESINKTFNELGDILKEEEENMDIEIL